METKEQIWEAQKASVKAGFFYDPNGCISPEDVPLEQLIERHQRFLQEQRLENEDDSFF